MSREHRFKEAYKFLRDCGEIHTQKELAIKMNSTESNISKAFRGDDIVLTNRFIKRFCEAFDNRINKEWMLTGEGEMLNDIKPKIYSNEETFREDVIHQLKRIANALETIANKE